MAVIDTHTHVGESLLIPEHFSEVELLATMDKWGVDVSLVMPHSHGAPTPEAAHDRVHALIQEHPGRFFGIADLNPMLSEAAYWKEAERCVTGLGFVAIKLHPLLHPCNPLWPRVTKVFEVARHFRIPVITHTGQGSPFSLPALLISRAREFPDVTIVLAHAGANFYTSEAIVAAQVCDNILLEPSWCGPHRVKEAINKLGSDRIMFGSDVPLNVAVELTKYRTIGLTDDQLEDCLGRNAARVYRLSVAASR
jgi:predicted TIM-barrel fold metal-dependent hydrolase